MSLEKNSKLTSSWTTLQHTHGRRDEIRRTSHLSPYFPMKNPIEMAFSTIKAAMIKKLHEQMAKIFDRQAAAAAAANLTLTVYRKNILKHIVRNVLLDGETITPEKCANWHQHTFQYIARDAEIVLHLWKPPQHPAKLPAPSSNCSWYTSSCPSQVLPLVRFCKQIE